MITEIAEASSPLRRLHHEIRSAVIAASEKTNIEKLASVAREEEGDTIYAVDKVGESFLEEFVTKEIASQTPLVLIAEGMKEGQRVLPPGTPESEAVWRIIIDPIDGTRGLMYQKRSAWILTGVAPNKGEKTNLEDIVLALQTEIPLVKQHLSDAAWAIAGREVAAERFNRLTGETEPINLKPSGAHTLAHGYGMISRFFPGAREELAAIDEEIVREALGPVKKGKAHCFEDQYICSGGQLFELMSGRDRFNADIRPLMEPWMAARGLTLGICCHPYDLCTELIARELGVIVTNERGERLSAPLDVSTDVSWVGYANSHIRSQIEPLLHQALNRRGLLPAREH